MGGGGESHTTSNVILYLFGFFRSLFLQSVSASKNISVALPHMEK